MKTHTLKTFLTYLLLAITIISFTNCSKSDSAPQKPKQTCHIITVSENSTTYNISYNSDGKITKVAYDTYVSSFTYGGNAIIINTTNSGSFSTKRTITLNDNGLVINIRDEYDASVTTLSNSALDYRGDELIKLTSTSNSGGAPSVTTYSWTNGNLTDVTSDSYSQTYDYYTDKPVADWDYLRFQLQLSYGNSVNIINNKNMIKSTSDGSTTTNFGYTFDEDGKVTAVSTNDGTTADILNYQYQCN
jgi:hypothetical protein